MKFIHDLSDVQSNKIGANTKIWQFTTVLKDAEIGSDCNICSNCFVENDVRIGNRVTIKNGVSVWDGVHLHDDVFVGPNVAFTNDYFPRSKMFPGKFLRTNIFKNASIGAGAVVLPGINVGANSMIGAGSVVTRNVPENAIVAGNPAKIIGYVDAHKDILRQSAFGAKKNISNSVEKSNISGVTMHKFPIISDIRGSLTVGEFNRQVPFIPKRYFMVFDVPSQETRGEHAHKLCHQFLICLKGTCSVVADDGVNREEFDLNSPDVGLYLKPLVWGTQYKYSADCVLLVFASDYYDADDYIRNYQEFLTIVGK
jgi:UDP-2-acetamido-3-amino-2,3-dideoxy-glucuronate N-acetyltransferase